MKHEKKTQKFQNKSEEISSFVPTCFQYKNKGHIKSNCSQNQKRSKDTEDLKKNLKKIYIAQDKNKRGSYDKFE